MLPNQLHGNMIANVLTLAVKLCHQRLFPVPYRGDYSSMRDLDNAQAVGDSADRRAVLKRLDTLMDGTDDDKKEALVLCRSLHTKVSENSVDRSLHSVLIRAGRFASNCQVSSTVLWLIYQCQTCVLVPGDYSAELCHGYWKVKQRCALFTFILLPFMW